jgi:hypothetical protein
LIARHSDLPAALFWAEAASIYRLPGDIPGKMDLLMPVGVVVGGFRSVAATGSIAAGSCEQGL